jgi:sulfoacetaldehyde acetyltransferase
VVFHNKQWGAEKKNQGGLLQHPFLGVNSENPSWAELAPLDGSGGRHRARPRRCRRALIPACEAQKAGKTTVVEVMCTMELGDPFRRDALKYPHSLLDKYKHTNVAAMAAE